MSSQVVVVQAGRKASSLPVDYEPSSVSVNQENGDIAVGGAADNTVCCVWPR